MPEPFATPKIFTVPEPAWNAAEASLGRVSVVMMARVKLMAASSVAHLAAIKPGSAARILSAGSGTPITPVEEGKISRAEAPSMFAARTQICSHADKPRGPVAQLALPELTRTARTLPLEERR